MKARSMWQHFGSSWTRWLRKSVAIWKHLSTLMDSCLMKLVEYGTQSRIIFLINKEQCQLRISLPAECLINIRVTLQIIMRNDVKLAKQMMNSALPPACFETLNILENFIHGQSENKEKLLNWLHWLSNRRIHWAKTFKWFNYTIFQPCWSSQCQLCSERKLQHLFSKSCLWRYCGQYMAGKTMGTIQSRCKNLWYWTFRFQPNCSGDSKTKERGCSISWGTGHLGFGKIPWRR